MAEAHGNVHFMAVCRLEGSTGVIIAQHSYNTETDLNAVRQVLQQPNLHMRARTHYQFGVASMAWHLMADEKQLIYVLVTQQKYPQRCAHACLEELQRTFTDKAGDKAVTAKDRSLDKTCGQLLQKLCQKYDDLSQVDKLAAVSAKVESVKLVMQDNVEIALQNCVKLESIEKAAEELQQQAGVFKRNANDLRKKMWWKNLKMKLILGAVILAILLAIIIPIAVWVNNAKQASKK